MHQFSWNDKSNKKKLSFYSATMQLQALKCMVGNMQILHFVHTFWYPFQRANLASAWEGGGSIPVRSGSSSAFLGFLPQICRWAWEIKSEVLITSCLEPHSFSASAAPWGQCCVVLASRYRKRVYLCWYQDNIPLDKTPPVKIPHPKPPSGQDCRTWRGWD